MKRLLTFLLVACMLCSLLGCKQQAPTEPQKLDNTALGILVNQACLQAQTLAMSTDSSYMQAFEFDEAIINLAATFGAAIGKTPAEAKITEIQNDEFLAHILEMCSQVYGVEHVACAGALTFSTQFYMETAPSQPTAIYLRYNEQCHMVVYFTTARTHIVNATIYPLFSETADAVVKEYFASCTGMTSAEIQQVCSDAAATSVDAKYTGSTISQLHFFKQSISAFSDIGLIDPLRIEDSSSDRKTAAMAKKFAAVLSNEASDVAVFYFPADVEHRISSLLNKNQYGTQLEALTKQRMYLSWTNRLIEQFGTECVEANSILAALANNRPLGSVPSEKSTPVLIVLELSNDVTMLMSIYPGEHHIYSYSFVCVPVAFWKACNFVRQAGAKPME